METTQYQQLADLVWMGAGALILASGLLLTAGAARMRTLGHDTFRPGLKRGATGLTAMGLGLAVLPLAIGMVGLIEDPLRAAFGASVVELMEFARSVAVGVVAVMFLAGALLVVFALGARPAGERDSP